MSIIFRYVTIGIFYSLVISVTVMGITLLDFPPERWSLLLENTILDLPFLVVVLTTPVVIGAIIGFSIGIYWHRRLHSVERQLNELIKGEFVVVGEEEPVKELARIHENIVQLQHKLQQQTEDKQRQATERAREREKSLQEVVIQERNRLARELHDSVSQQLFAASMMMSAINEANPLEDATMKQQLVMIEKMIHQSQLEMRALLLHLRPAALKNKDLKEGIEELLTELRQKVPMEITWKVEPFKVDKGIEDHLFRILQESISNTLRHAQAKALHVMLIKRDDFVILRVVDDGIGFDVEKAGSGSYGLQHMQERAQELGGTSKIISLPNQGTRLEVKIPYVTRKEGDDK